MKKLLYFSILCLLFAQACESSIIIEQEGPISDVTENKIHYLVTATHPSDQKSPETKVVLEGDSPSAPIVSKWQGSTSSFRDRFAIIGEDNDGNIAHVTDAIRLADETEDSIAGTFEFTIDRDYWIADLEYKRFYALYPTRDPDWEYLSGNDYDNDNWVYSFSEQSGHFSDLTNNLFMVSPRIDLDNPSIDFQYGIAILRLSNLSVPDLIGKTVSNIKVKSNAIRDAIVFNSSCYFSDYYAAGHDINITGNYSVNASGIIDDNIYVVFYPSSESLDYLVISLESDGRKYSFEYSGGLTSFSAGKVYTLNGAGLSYKDTSPDFSWYLNPIAEDHYLISNAKEFLGFQKIVNGDEEALSVVGIEEADKFESKTIDLAAGATIDLSNVLSPRESWIPIDGFKGCLNGNGSDIMNFYIDISARINGGKYGLFSSIESATLESINVSGRMRMSGTYNGYVGGLVADVNQSTIINCSTSISMSHSGGEGNCVGGVAGRLRQSFMIGCSDYSSIMVSTDGISEYAGGVVGFASSWSTLTACSHFEGQVSVSYRSYAGGVIGREHNDTHITACYNNGSIVLGSQGGQIHGGSNTTAFPNISSCYYSGSYSGNGGNGYFGIGMYPGQSFDSGTQRVKTAEEMIAATQDMNSKIEEWNSSNPTQQCSRRYYVENDQIVFK